MPALPMTSYGPLAIYDTGAPDVPGDYTTLVMLHGYAWHSGTFVRLLPFASQLHARIVLVNRRDYPGATPYDELEVAQLHTALQPTPDAAATLREYAKARAKELYDFLESFIVYENITKEGGIVVAGWSLGSVLLTALLTHAPTFPVHRVDVASFIKYVVGYDTPYSTVGYPPPATIYNPLHDPSLAPGEGIKQFPVWASGYYKHGELPYGLQQRTALVDPRPSLFRMSEDEMKSAIYSPPGEPGGSDQMLEQANKQHGLFRNLRLAALFPEVTTDTWSQVKWRSVWGDQSTWEIPWCTWLMQTELKEAEETGTRTRPVEFVRLREANHFAHWDQPEQLLRAVFGDTLAVIDKQS